MPQRSARLNTPAQLMLSVQSKIPKQRALAYLI
jgi:hypothetical protein